MAKEPPDQNGQAQKPGVSWRPAASFLGSGAGGAGISFALTRATPEQIAWGVALWSLVSLGTVIGFIAKAWVERRYVHAEELARERADAMWWRAKFFDVEGKAQQNIQTARAATDLASSVVSKASPSSLSEYDVRMIVQETTKRILEGQSEDTPRSGGEMS